MHGRRHAWVLGLGMRRAMRGHLMLLGLLLMLNLHSAHPGAARPKPSTVWRTAAAAGAVAHLPRVLRRAGDIDVGIRSGCSVIRCRWARGTGLVVRMLLSLIWRDSGRPLGGRGFRGEGGDGG